METIDARRCFGRSHLVRAVALVTLVTASLWLLIAPSHDQHRQQSGASVSHCAQGVNGFPLLMADQVMIVVNHSDGVAFVAPVSGRWQGDDDAYRMHTCVQTGLFRQDFRIVDEGTLATMTVRHKLPCRRLGARSVTVLHPAWQRTQSYHGIAGPSGLMQYHATARAVRTELGADVEVHIYPTLRYVGRGEPSLMAEALQGAVLPLLRASVEPNSSRPLSCLHAPRGAWIAFGLTGRNIFYKEDLGFFNTHFVPTLEARAAFVAMRRDLIAGVEQRYRHDEGLTATVISGVLYLQRPYEVVRYPQGQRIRGMTPQVADAVLGVISRALPMLQDGLVRVNVTSTPIDVQIHAARRAKWVLVAEGAGTLWAMIRPLDANVTYVVVHQHVWNAFDSKWGRNFHSGLPFLSGHRVVLVTIEGDVWPVNAQRALEQLLRNTTFEAGFIYLDARGGTYYEPWCGLARRQGLLHNFTAEGGPSD